MVNKLEQPKNVWAAVWIGVVGSGFIGLSFIFPEKLWALHDICFLDYSVIGQVFGLAFLVAYLVSVVQNKQPSLFLRYSFLGWVLVSMLVLVFSSVYFYFSICFDDYGNAFEYRDYAKVIALEYPQSIISDFFSFNLQPSSGRKTVLNMYSLISFESQLPYSDIFKWAGVGSGVLFGVGLLAIASNTKNWGSRFSFLAIASIAPVTMVFHQHYEIYAPVYASVMLWFALFQFALKSDNPLLMISLALWSLVCLKLHPLCGVLLIGFVLTIGVKARYTANIVVWKNVLRFIVIPALVIGVVVYFFVAKDYNDPRFLEGVTDADRVFLPLIAPPAPLHTYNLFSWNHILDYFNVVLLWSIPGLIIIIFGGLTRAVNWNRPLILIPGSMGLMLALFLFPINPLLSMPMDRDLFMFPSLFLLVAAYGVLLEMTRANQTRFVLPLAMFFLVLQAPRILVDNQPSLLAKKLEVTGSHIFKTYYIHSVRVMINGLNLTKNADDYITGKARVINQLKPYATKGNDPKYANLLMDDGNFYLKYKHNPAKAAQILSEALAYDPNSEHIKRLLKEANIKRNR